jgi:hypothetical protein
MSDCIIVKRKRRPLPNGARKMYCVTHLREWWDILECWPLSKCPFALADTEPINADGSDKT